MTGAFLTKMVQEWLEVGKGRGLYTSPYHLSYKEDLIGFT